MVEHIDGPLHAEAMGDSDAPPMVFVHPNPVDSSSWIYQLAHFSTWYRTVAVDLPGYGRSPSAAEGVTMPDIAQACWEAVDQHAKGPAVLVGCSVGANVVQHMYHLRPETTVAVVLSGTGAHDPTKRKPFAAHRIGGFEEQGIDYRRRFALEGFSRTFRETDTARWFVNLIEERNDRADVPTIVATLAALAEPDPPWLRRELDAPVLIVGGSVDKSHARASGLAEQIHDVEVATIEGAGHACYAEDPLAYDLTVLDFLTRRVGIPGLSR